MVNLEAWYAMGGIQGHTYGLRILQIWITAPPQQHADTPLWLLSVQAPAAEMHNCVQVCVIKLPVETLLENLEAILQGLLIWSQDSKNKFRLKVVPSEPVFLALLKLQWQVKVQGWADQLINFNQHSH